MPRVAITELTESHLDGAAALLAARHVQHRASEPLLASRFEQRLHARDEIAVLLGRDGAGGVAAVEAGRVTGFLVGTPRKGQAWGPSMWVEPAGHAVEQAETVRDLYAAAAQDWVAAGRTCHYVVVPATDPALVDAWFRLGFGHQHVLALREPPAETVDPPAGLEIRPATRADIEPLARLDLLLPEHQARSPVFSTLELPTLASLLEEWEQTVDDPGQATFVAVEAGQVVGTAVACSADLSSVHIGVARPDDAGQLGFAAVLPQGRGRGSGRALATAAMNWATGQGYGTIVIDWRMTNLLASRCWPSLGFRPSFFRLFRSVG